MTSTANRRQGWWKNEIVRRSSSLVDEHVRELVHQSPFIRDTESRPIPTFERSEIEVGDLLGEGSFSRVHEVVAFALNESMEEDCFLEDESEAKDDLRLRVSSSESRYVIKHLKPELVLQEDQTSNNHKLFGRAAADLVMEAKYLARLDHPHILKLRGMAGDMSTFAQGHHDGFFLVTDRLVETLQDRIREWRNVGATDKRLQHRHQVLTISLQVARALEYLHERQIVFRDLKPSNIGFDDYGNVQLFDFGLCREVYPEDGEEEFYMSGAGTLRYMAPEVLLMEASNCKADVYSWSMVLYEMLTCERPFPDYHSVQDYLEFVCLDQERPCLDQQITSSLMLQRLLEQSWNADVAERLDISQVVNQVERSLRAPIQRKWSTIKRVVESQMTQFNNMLWSDPQKREKFLY